MPRSRDIIEKTNKTFQEKYQGGHPMRDPTFLEKYKEARAIDPHYDIEAAKSTNIERYGVDFHAQTKESRERSRANMANLHKEGRAFSGKNKKGCPDSARLKTMFSEGYTLSVMAQEFEVSEIVLSRWVKELGLVRGTIASTRTLISSEELLQEYQRCCKEAGALLSPYAFGKIKGAAWCLKLKRLFRAQPELKSLSKKLLESVEHRTIL